MPTSPLAPLHVAALAFLSERDMHPYEMFQILRRRGEERVVKASAGSLYRAVYALEERGLCRATGAMREGLRPERTNYAITAEGRDALQESLRGMLQTPAVEFPQFALALSEIHSLPAAEGAALLRRRIERLEDDIAATTTWMEYAVEVGVPERYWLDGPYRVDVLRAQILHLHRLIARLDDDDISWTDRMDTLQRHPRPASTRATARPTDQTL